MMSDLEIAVKTERDHQKWDDMIKSINMVTRVKVSIIMQASQGKTTRVANKIYGWHDRVKMINIIYYIIANMINRIHVPGLVKMRTEQLAR